MVSGSFCRPVIRYFATLWVAVICVAAAFPSQAQEETVGDYVVTPDETATFVSPDGLVTIQLIVNSETVVGASGALSLLTAAPGAIVPEHVHEDSAEVLYILQGAGHLTAAGDTVQLGPGQTVYIPPGVPHSYVNDGALDFRAVQLYLPGGAEARFREWNPAQ